MTQQTTDNQESELDESNSHSSNNVQNGFSTQNYIQ